MKCIVCGVSAIFKKYLNGKLVGLCRKHKDSIQHIWLAPRNDHGQMRRAMRS